MFLGLPPLGFGQLAAQRGGLVTLFPETKHVCTCPDVRLGTRGHGVPGRTAGQRGATLQGSFARSADRAVSRNAVVSASSLPASCMCPSTFSPCIPYYTLRPSLKRGGSTPPLQNRRPSPPALPPKPVQPQLCTLRWAHCSSEPSASLLSSSSSLPLLALHCSSRCSSYSPFLHLPPYLAPLSPLLTMCSPPVAPPVRLPPTVCYT